MSGTAARETFDGVADSEPRGNGVAALHPAKYPGDGAQVFQGAIRGAAGGAGADAGVLQFVHRSGLLEVFEDFRIFGNVFAIEREGVVRH